MLMQIALVVAQRGTCDRAQVGAVITRDGRIISVGYNGAPPGLPHCEENNHGWYDAPHHDDHNLGCRNATHAEANALCFAAQYGISTDEAELFVTVAPCDTCSRLLIAAGIAAVVYLDEYRNSKGIQTMSSAGIVVAKFEVSEPA